MADGLGPVEIATAERYRALLAAESTTADEAAVGMVATEAVGGMTAVAADGAQQRKALFVGLVGALAVALGGVALVLLRRGRTTATGSDDMGATGPRAVPPTQRSPVTARLLCPVCGATEPPGAAQFCPHDGTKLVSEAEHRAPAPPAAPVTPVPPAARGTVCPTCGTRYEAGATFCGRDGTALVLVN